MSEEEFFDGKAYRKINPAQAKEFLRSYDLFEVTFHRLMPNFMYEALRKSVTAQEYIKSGVSRELGEIFPFAIEHCDSGFSPSNVDPGVGESDEAQSGTLSLQIRSFRAFSRIVNWVKTPISTGPGCTPLQ